MRKKLEFIGASALASVLLVSLATPAAAVTLFTDRASWEAAVGAFQTDTFSNNIAQANQITLDSGIVSTALTGTISNSNSVSGGQFNGFVNQTGNFDLGWDFNFGAVGAIIGFGGDFSALNVPNGLTVSGDFDGTGVQTVSVAQTVGAAFGFFGLVGDAPFSSVRWSSNDGSGSSSGEAYSVDNFSFSVVSVVPEPATAGLLLIGLIGAGLRRRSRAA